jgi:putative sigma-54 modulation protein
MQVDISGRHFQLSEGLRDHALQKLHKLDKFNLKIETAHVIFEVQKITHFCEILLLGKNLRLTAKTSTSDSYASFDQAVTSLQKQLSRYHERIKDHRHSE